MQTEIFQLKECITNFELFFAEKNFRFSIYLKEKKRNKFITEITSFLNRPTKTGWTSPYKCKLDFFCNL